MMQELHNSMDYTAELMH